MVSTSSKCTAALSSLPRPRAPHRIAGVREEPRIREQVFGNFQDRDRMRVEKEIRQRHGRFFYRFPNGESAADVYDRITGFRETLRADIDIGIFQPPGQRSRNMNVVIVSHGLTLRVFLMRWYKSLRETSDLPGTQQKPKCSRQNIYSRQSVHGLISSAKQTLPRAKSRAHGKLPVSRSEWTVRQFEGLSNLNNGGTLVMQTDQGGRYSLLVHHTADELREFGLTDEMLQDQMWQKTAKFGELNYNFMTKGQSFFYSHIPFASPD